MAHIQKPQPQLINGVSAYSADELFEYDKRFFINCPRVRFVIEKQQISEEHYFFAYNKKGIWVKSTANYPRAKLFLLEEYVLQNILKMMDEPADCDIRENPRYEEAPHILNLTPEECFKTKDGKIIKIEVRGEREYDKCFFRVKDVSVGFDIPNLSITLTCSVSSYERDIDYKVMSVNKSTKGYLYLTYEGMIKLLYVSRNDNARQFRRWATEKLFIMQMGDQSQRDTLAAELLGVNTQTIADVFRANSGKTPVVYLYMIGRATDLLDGNYTADDLLCKYGCTDDLPRRAKELQRLFKKEFSTQIELLQFSIIDAKFIFDAEAAVARYFQMSSVSYENTKELVIINSRELPQIKQFYGMLHNNYIGCYKELDDKIHELEREIIVLQNKLDTQTIVMEKDALIEKERHSAELATHIHQVELLQERHRAEMTQKENEILTMKVKMLMGAARGGGDVVDI